MTENGDPKFRALFREEARKLSPLPEPQDYPGLDAAGFLLVALGHLVKAKEKLDQEPPSRGRYAGSIAIREATNYVRHALRELDELKEETCEKP